MYIHAKSTKRYWPATNNIVIRSLSLIDLSLKTDNFSLQNLISDLYQWTDFIGGGCHGRGHGHRDHHHDHGDLHLDYDGDDDDKADSDSGVDYDNEFDDNADDDSSSANRQQKARPACKVASR